MVSNILVIIFYISAIIFVSYFIINGRDDGYEDDNFN